MSLFTKNIEVLLERFPDFPVSKEMDPVTDNTISVEQAKNGEVTAVHNGTYLHSKIDPSREARRTVEAAAIGGVSCIACLGFGLGYLVEQVGSLHPGVPIVVIEANIDLFISALKYRDLTGILSSESVSLLVGADLGALSSALMELRAGSVAVLPLRSVYPHYKTYYDESRAAIADYLQRREVNKNTLARFGKLWIRNLTANIDLLAAAPGITRFRDTFNGIPALVVAAGPSLDHVTAYLEVLRLKCVIIAVDTSLKACLAAGVEPDFVIIVDPQYWNTRHLDYCAVENAFIISESSTHPRTFRILPGKLAFCGSLFPLGTYMEQHIGEFGTLGAGGSVATSAWDFARYIGCSRIYCAGLDLGFPNLATHFHGSTFEERTHTLSGRIGPSEHAAFLALRDAGPYPVANNAGTETLTDNRLSIYRGWFESQMRLHPATESYNLSEFGIEIEGMPYRRIDALTEMDDKRDEIDRALASAEGSGQPVDQKTRRSRVLTATTQLIENLKDLHSAASEAMDIIERLRSLPAGEASARNGYLEKLNEIDRRIMESGEREIAGFLVHGVAMDILDATGESAPVDPLTSSETLYRELADAISYHIELLGRATTS